MLKKKKHLSNFYRVCSSCDAVVTRCYTVVIGVKMCYYMFPASYAVGSEVSHINTYTDSSKYLNSLEVVREKKVPLKLHLKTKVCWRINAVIFEKVFH